LKGDKFNSIWIG